MIDARLLPPRWRPVPPAGPRRILIPNARVEEMPEGGVRIVASAEPGVSLEAFIPECRLHWPSYPSLLLSPPMILCAGCMSPAAVADSAETQWWRAVHGLIALWLGAAA